MRACPCVRLHLQVPFAIDRHHLKSSIPATALSSICNYVEAVAVCLQAAIIYYQEKTRATVPVALDDPFPLHTTQVQLFQVL